jgi:flagellar basal-body rod protein FlgC
MNSLFAIMDVGATGMAAERMRVQLVAANLANSETTRTAEGGPYRRKDAVFQVVPMGTTPDGLPLTGVKVSGVHASDDPFPTRYDPGHPDAGPDGMVKYPNVNPVEEMVNLTEATQAFGADVTVVRAARGMATSALDLLRAQ